MEHIDVIITVCIFGVSNLAISVFFLGGMKFAVDHLLEWKLRAEEQIGTLEAELEGVKAKCSAKSGC